MNICVKNEGEMKNVPKNQIINGDPLSWFFCFLESRITFIVGCGDQLMSQPYFERVWRWNWHSQNGDLKVLRVSEISEFDCKGQNTSHWGVLYIIGNLLKCKCRKWACMGHLDICSTRYGKKKGRKSNWQFDSRSLKVVNWPDVDACRWSVTHRWKALEESYKFVSDLIPIKGLNK
jgi:hypothetical protein